MDETRVFKTYNRLLEPAAGPAAYDYAGAGYYEDIPAPRRRSARPVQEPVRRAREWVREQPEDAEVLDEIEARPISRRGQGVSLLTVGGFALAAVLLVMLLMSHIRMTAVSDAAAASQTRVEELTEQQHKLQARYEEAFSLGEVERYATEELGMQKPRAGQITYLDGLGGADRAEVIVQEEKNTRTPYFAGLMDCIRSYFG